MRYVLLALCVASVLAVACGGGEEGDDSLGIPDWAALVCDVAQDYAEDSATLSESVESIAGLALDARKERATTLVTGLRVILGLSADRLAAVSAPTEAREYHSALLAQYQELTEEMKRAEEAVQTATTETQIEAINASINIVVEETQANVQQATSNLPLAAAAALRGVNACGNTVP